MRAILLEYVGFLASFWMLGAVGFRYAVLRSDQGVFRSAAARAAMVGMGGVGLGLLSFVVGMLQRAVAKHQTFGEAFSAGGAVAIAQLVSLGVLLVAFTLAWRRIAIGWPIAVAAALAFALRNALGGRLSAMVNPLHVLGGSLWIGTLFVLVVCGIAEMLRRGDTDREEIVAAMVHRFSFLALASASLLATTGVITSWTHLKTIDALWRTSYGNALVCKLCVVLIVLGLGAWNWQRVGPSLGTEGGAMKIRKTATTELGFAGIVLLITALLVTLPSPKAAGSAPASRAKANAAP